jgi:hypothetical protein
MDKEGVMADYPYVKVQDKLKKFLQHIQTAGVPPKVSQEYLKTAGFKSSNDQRILNVLRFIGFIDGNGNPSEDYKRYRNKQQAPSVLGPAIRQGYAELFGMYPNANQQDVEALRNFFSSHTTAGEQVLAAMVSTFRTLCNEASFEPSTVPVTEVSKAPAPTPRISAVKVLDTQSLTLNIQLTLPETTNSEVYKEIFKAMRTYLIENGK